MADYKVVDAEQLNADITQIANAIREKAGTTDAMLFPSGLVEAIANMETGGGLPSGIKAIEYGEYIPTSSQIVTSDGFSISHSLGEMPDFFYMVCLDDIVSYSDHTSYIVPYFYLVSKVLGIYEIGKAHYEAKVYYGVRNDASDLQYYGAGMSYSDEANSHLKSDRVIVAARTNYSPCYMFLKSGRKYKWVAGKFA